jgi:Retron-type reverse transcriptase
VGNATGGKPREGLYSLQSLLCKAISRGKHYLYAEIGEIMETKLERISQLSKEKPEMVFTSIGHLINKEMLKECHEKMDGKKAVGIDGVTKEEYEEKLEENLDSLIGRLKGKSYRPKPARRVEIPKDNGKTRPLSIYCYEDKVVQEALKRILEAVFEPHFCEEMMGFRPGRSCHQAIQKLNRMLEENPTNYVLDADIKSFFNNLNHEWIIRFIESRITDPNIIRLVRRMLKAGVMENFQYEPTEEGSGQGSGTSPIIANIYMHYVLVWWFREVIKPHMKGYSGLIVYADDFVVCFEYKEDAEKFYEHLTKRMKNFGLRLEEEKSRLIEFGRYAQAKAEKAGKKPETFNFLGFTHYCSKGRSGWFRVKRKTSKKKFSKKCKEVHAQIGKMRHQKVRDIIKRLNSMLTGYFHYYGITDNSRSISRFRYKVIKSLYFWLNRRSQKKSYTWEGFNEMLKVYPLVNAKIYVSVYAR